MTETPYFISYDEALTLVKSHALDISSEEVHLDQAHGRILAKDLQSTVNDPRFDNSAMDGFAFIHADTLSPPTTLSITQTLQAGDQSPSISITSGNACRIMTGAPIPPGADAILPIELCTVNADNTAVTLNEVGKKHFIRKRGENLRLGETALVRGTLLNPSTIGLCATMGYPKIPVFSKLTIGVISTGDELQQPGRSLGPNQIYESNSFGLCGLIQWSGHIPRRYDAVADTMNLLRQKLDQAADECDLILTSGGVSMGEWDFVRKIMEEEGDIRFWRVKLRPGSPPLFGYWKGTPIFGLPGNPASSHVVYRMLVAPFLRASTAEGGNREAKIRVKLGESFKTDEKCLVLRRIKIDTSGEHNVAFSTGYQGSGNLNSLVMADGLTLFKPGHSGEKDTWVDALLM